MADTERSIQKTVDDALDTYRDAMRSFITRNLRSVRGRKPEDLILDALRGQAYDNAESAIKRGDRLENAFDVNGFYYIINQNWREAFAEYFNNDKSVLSAITQVANIRTRASHPRYEEDMDRREAMARLNDMETVLSRIGALDKSQIIRDEWDRLDKQTAASQPSQPQTAPQPTATALSAGRSKVGNGTSSLKSWRDVISPRLSVANGTTLNSEFAASLSAVYSGRADADYGDPFKFFRGTYITGGMEALLINVLTRISGKGGDPVIQAETSFGGGKTHSLIALYHLIENADALINPAKNASREHIRISEEITRIIKRAGIDPNDGIPNNIAVIDCNEITASSPNKTMSGDPLNTIWGEIAHQLGRQEAYDIIGVPAREWYSPGTAELRALFKHVGPCVILIDELVAHARNLPSDKAGRFASFVQYLTEAVSQSDNVALVLTVPEAGIEIGDTASSAVEASIRHITRRLDKSWQPLEARETYEIIRRRLFSDEIDVDERARTCQAFASMYSNRKGDYPPEASETRYMERLMECYPIHPEIFDRVFTDWSSNPRFQRTRGALRVMATAVSRLYQRQDSSPMIMPGSLPLDNIDLHSQFTSLITGNWDAAMKEIDSDDGKLDEIDSKDSRCVEVGGASRRIARAIFLGSMPGRALMGIDEQHLNLAVVKPGDGAATYRDALNRMSGSLYHLYEEGGRYYFHNEENLNRLAADRKSDVTLERQDEAIIERLKFAMPGSMRGQVIISPESPADVPDIQNARLVVMHPRYPLHTRRDEMDAANDARNAALHILLHRDENTPPTPRIHKNTLLFLAAERESLKTLKDRTAEYLAWNSIVNPTDSPIRLTQERKGLAARNLEEARQAMDTALASAFQHMLNPVQHDGAKPEYEITNHRSSARKSGEIILNAMSTLEDIDLLTRKLSGKALMDSIDREIVWKKENLHYQVGALWNAFTDGVFMPYRLAGKETLEEAIADGVAQGVFGYAEKESNGSLYPGVMLGQRPFLIADSGLIVRREIAEDALKEQQKQEGYTPAAEAPFGAPLINPDLDEPAGGPNDAPRKVTKRELRKTLSADYEHELAQIAQEILSNMQGAIVTIIISAEKQDGFDENSLRAINENSAQLGIEPQQ